MRLRQILPCLLLSWFFMLENITIGSHTVIGPFDTKDACNTMKGWVFNGPLVKGGRVQDLPKLGSLVTGGRADVRLSDCWEGKN